MCILHTSKHCKLSTRSDQENSGNGGGCEERVRAHLAAWLKAESNICFIFHVLRLICKVSPYYDGKSIDGPEEDRDEYPVFVFHPKGPISGQLSDCYCSSWAPVKCKTND